MRIPGNKHQWLIAIPTVALLALASSTCWNSRSTPKPLNPQGLHESELHLGRERLSALVAGNGDILVPPNIKWYRQSPQGAVYGYKLRHQKPFDYFSDEWEKEAYFLIEGDSVRWFETWSSFDQAMKGLPK